MDIKEIIRKRVSCRTYEQTFLKSSDRKTLEDCIKTTMGLGGKEAIDLIIIEKKPSGKKMLLDYGVIRGHNCYLLGKTTSSADSRVHYGYLVEKIILKATEIGVSTCWVGYFDPLYFDELKIEQGKEIPSIVILGYAKETQTYPDRIVRLSVRATYRLNWEKLFFDYNSGLPLSPHSTNGYADALEMVRLAPSSGNTQPWRVFFDESTKEFHFFKQPIKKRYEEKGLHDIDLGIALSHFELTASQDNLSGKWISCPEGKILLKEHLQYVKTWKCG